MRPSPVRRWRAPRRLFAIAGVEAGHVCPLTMTHASVAALAANPERLAEWLPKIRSRSYDPRFIPFWDKNSVTLGMGMTEKQGGSDVRANTYARRSWQPATNIALTGHKWFMSAPMCDAFLMLAQAPGGLTCFLLPRFRPDGSRQRAAVAAAEGQARQPLQRLLRGGVRQRLRVADRRGRAWRHDHHQDGAR